MTIFLDLDGVLADLVGPLCCVHGFDPARWPLGEYDFAKVFGKTQRETWQHPGVLGAEFWASLPRLPWFDDLLALVGGPKNVTILTKPVCDPGCVVGKATWLSRHLPRVPFVITPNKSTFARPGAVLIDDSDAEVDAWNAPRGIGILFPAAWNRLHEQRGDPVRALARVLDCLEVEGL